MKYFQHFIIKKSFLTFCKSYHIAYNTYTYKRKKATTIALIKFISIKRESINKEKTTDNTATPTILEITSLI